MHCFVGFYMTACQPVLCQFGTAGLVSSKPLPAPTHNLFFAVWLTSLHVVNLTNVSEHIHCLIFDGVSNFQLLSIMGRFFVFMADNKCPRFEAKITLLHSPVNYQNTISAKIKSTRIPQWQIECWEFQGAPRWHRAQTLCWCSYLKGQFRIVSNNYWTQLNRQASCSTCFLNPDQAVDMCVACGWSFATVRSGRFSHSSWEYQ